MEIMAIDEKRSIKRRAIDECPHDCAVCYRYNLQINGLLWIAGGVASVLVILLTLGLSNKEDISVLNTDAGIARVKADYTIDSLNEIKGAMGLQIRMPPKLEALK